MDELISVKSAIFLFINVALIYCVLIFLEFRMAPCPDLSDDGDDDDDDDF